MKHAIYNTATGEFDYENELSSKRVEKGGRVSYGDWTSCLIFNKQDMEVLGKPNSLTAPQFYEGPDGQLHKLHPSFKFISDKDRDKSTQQPWFGKVLVFEDGTFYDLEEDKPMFKEDTKEFESFEPCDKDTYIAFHHDWSSFDEFGGFDDSYYALKKNGATLLKTRRMWAEYKNGEFCTVSTGKERYNVEQLEARQTLKETVEKLMEMGESAEYIGAMVAKTIKDNQKQEPEQE